MRAADSPFSSELFEFLRQLKRHNRREWFAANKERYETVARMPALRFIECFAPLLERISPYLVANSHPTCGSLFRIYRDIRFSSDKRPYKTHIGIQFTHATGKDVHGPCFYLHLEPENCFAAAGLWHPDSRALVKVRDAIVRQPKEWDKARRNLELEGESLQRPPRGYDPAHPFIEDLKRKDFIASIALRDAEVLDQRFVVTFARACTKMAPLVKFTSTALGLKF